VIHIPSSLKKKKKHYKVENKYLTIVLEFERMDLKGFEWICVDERVVWINGWMVRFEGI